MNTKHVLLAFAVVSALAVVLTERDAAATDSKEYSAPTCRWFGLGTPKLTDSINLAGMYLYDVSTTSSVLGICPLVRDNTLEKYPKSLKVVVNDSHSTSVVKAVFYTIGPFNASGSWSSQKTTSGSSGDVVISWSFASWSGPAAQSWYVHLVLPPTESTQYNASHLKSIVVEEF